MPPELEGEAKLLWLINTRKQEFTKPIVFPDSLEQCFNLRNQIHSHICEEFKAKEDEMFQMRIKAFKMGDWPNYDKIIETTEQLRK